MITERLRRAGIATGVVFAVSGVAQGTWASRIPALRDAVGATEAELGRALLAMGIGSLLSMPLTGRVVSRVGSKRVITITAAVALTAMVMLAFASSVLMLAAALFVFGFSYGAWDVAMNVHGHAAESQAGRDWMPRYHAMWSFGAMIGAVLGVGAAALDVSPRGHFLTAALVSAPVLVVALTMFISDRAVAAAADEHAHDQPRAARRFLSPRLAAIGALTLSGTIAEGAASDWFALLLADERGATEAGAAAGYTVFALAMGLTRFAGPQIIAWRGRTAALRLAGVALTVGVVVTLAVPVLAAAYVGALLWGLGAALVFPAAMSAAGETPGRSADAIAFAATLGYAAILVGPPLIGFLGHAIGLGTALWVVAIGGLGVFLFAPAAAERRAAVRDA